MRDIKDLIPHRDPFLFLDNLIEVNEGRIIGEKTFVDEDFFRGHFPSFPVVPGVIVVEAMAQCGGAGVAEAGLVDEETIFFLAKIDNVKFRKPSPPHTTLRFEIENVKISRRLIKQKGIAYIMGEEKQIAVEAEWTCLTGNIPRE